MLEKVSPEFMNAVNRSAQMLRSDDFSEFPEKEISPLTAYTLACRALEDNDRSDDLQDILLLLEYALLVGGYWHQLADLWEKEPDFCKEAKESVQHRLEQAAEQENAHALFFLGYLREKEGHPEYLDYYTKAAQYGECEALYRRGLSLFYDEKTAEAVECFRRAADQEHLEASCFFGYCCEEGLGISPDPVLAVQYYQQAAELPYAAYRLGVYCESAAESDQELRQAAEHYMEYLNAISAHAEDPLCSGSETGEVYLRLGRCLLALELSKRPFFAPSPLECFENAYGYAETRETEGEALFQKGYMYLFGIQTTFDPTEGRALLAEAAECGNLQAVGLLEEIHGWEQVSEECSDNADYEARKREAILRLGILERKGMDTTVRISFAGNGIPGYATDDCCGFSSFCADEYPEIQEAVEKLERRGMTVYFIHVSLTLSFGYLVSLFYISDNPEEWPSDRRDLLRGNPIVACANLTEGYTEIGRISFRISENVMERIN